MKITILISIVVSLISCTKENKAEIEIKQIRQILNSPENIKILQFVTYCESIMEQYNNKNDDNPINVDTSKLKMLITTTNHSIDILLSCLNKIEEIDKEIDCKNKILNNYKTIQVVNIGMYNIISTYNSSSNDKLIQMLIIHSNNSEKQKKVNKEMMDSLNKFIQKYKIKLEN